MSEMKKNHPYPVSINTDASRNHDDGSSAHIAKLAQDNFSWPNCSELISEDEWPASSSHLVPLNCHVWRSSWMIQFITSWRYR